MARDQHSWGDDTCRSATYNLTDWEGPGSLTSLQLIEPPGRGPHLSIIHQGKSYFLPATDTVVALFTLAVKYPPEGEGIYHFYCAVIEAQKP